MSHLSITADTISFECASACSLGPHNGFCVPVRTAKRVQELCPTVQRCLFSALAKKCVHDDFTKSGSDESMKHLFLTTSIMGPI